MGDVLIIINCRISRFYKPRINCGLCFLYSDIVDFYQDYNRFHDPRTLWYINPLAYTSCARLLRKRVRSYFG